MNRPRSPDALDPAPHGPLPAPEPQVASPGPPLLPVQVKLPRTGAGESRNVPGTENARTIDPQHGADRFGAVPPPRMTLLPRQLSAIEFDLFLGTGEPILVATGQTLFRRGEAGRHMFVVESGRIELDFGDDLPRKYIEAQEYFGELALFIGEHGRMANATALEPARLRVVDRDDFERLLASSPEVLARFMLRSFSYLVASEQHLIQNLRRRNEELMQTLDSLRRTRGELGAARRLSISDELTGLANRRGLYQHLESLREHPPQPERRLGLLLVDVDHFKQINDRNGHLVGDRVLQGVADCLRRAAGSDDLPCRLGGDEFALLLVASDPEQLAERAARLVAMVRQMQLVEGAPGLRPSVSVGGCLADPSEEWAVCYSHADTALYRVKAQGGDGWSLY